MTATFRPFAPTNDYENITAFLRVYYQVDNRDANWMWPVWEYAYTHPYFDHSAVDRIGVWEADGRIVAVASYEMSPGEAWLNTAPGWDRLKRETLDHSEAHLPAENEQGRRVLRLHVWDCDADLHRLVRRRGYAPQRAGDWNVSAFEVPSPFPEIGLPEGFRLQSLADENDLRKVSRVLHRGCDHPGEPDDADIDGRARMQSGPHFRADLTAVVVAPDGQFVSFCGMWLDVAHGWAVVEPVATDPDYRRRGLGRAVVLEGIRRCAAEGATIVYVGTDKPFYPSFGFRRRYVIHCLEKTFDWGRDSPGAPS